MQIKLLVVVVVTVVVFSLFYGVVQKKMCGIPVVSHSVLSGWVLTSLGVLAYKS